MVISNNSFWIKSSIIHGVMLILVMLFGGAKCYAAESVSVDEVSLSLADGEVGINFYMKGLESYATTGNTYISLNDKEIKIDGPTSGSKYVYTAYVNAKEMGDSITVHVYTKSSSGKKTTIALGNSKTQDGKFVYSVYGYTDSVINRQDSLGSLAKAMKNYGLCAQYYFGYNAPESLPAVSGGIDYSEYQTETNGSLPEGVTYYGSSLILSSDTTIRHYFYVDNAANLTFKIDGANVTSKQADAGLCYVEVTGIKATDLGNKHELKITGSGKTYTIKYCALSYCEKVQTKSDDEGLKTLASSIYWYYEAAKAYFSQEPGEEEDETEKIVVSSADELTKALKNVKPGETILLKGGTYEGHFYCNVSGTAEAPITIAAYPDENAILTIPQNSDGAALYTNGKDYITIRGLSFDNLKSTEAYGIVMYGGDTHITIKDCEFSHIETTDPGTEDEPGGGANAILLLGEKTDSISDIIIENNKVHDNVNGWSENISVAGNCENVYIRNNTVYNCTNIGIDFYGNAKYCKEDLSKDQPRNCECTGNTVYNCNSFYAENAGIYVDGSYNILIENNETYGNFYGIEIGSEEWDKSYTDAKRVQNIVVKGNNIHDNTECGIRIGGWTNDNKTGVVYNCVIRDNTFNNNETEILLAKCDTIYFWNNSFAGGVSIQDAIEHDSEISSSKITNIKYELPGDGR